MRLHEWIKLSGSDEAKFAAQIKTTEMAVRRYCRGVRIPARDQMRRIWLATDGQVTPNDFYDFSEELSGSGEASVEDGSPGSTPIGPSGDRSAA